MAHNYGEWSDLNKTVMEGAMALQALAMREIIRSFAPPTPANDVMLMTNDQLFEEAERCGHMWSIGDGQKCACELCKLLGPIIMQNALGAMANGPQQ